MFVMHVTTGKCHVHLTALLGLCHNSHLSSKYFFINRLVAHVKEIIVEA